MKKELVRESRWEKVYRTGANTWTHQSKFLDPRFELKASDFEAIWPRMTQEERTEFCVAYRAKPAFTTEDEQILNVIMQTGNDVVWNSVASMLPRHPDRSRVLAFIRDRLQRQSPPLANFYSAIETLHDVGSLPVLRRKYGQYQSESKVTAETSDRVLCLDFLTCCRALWKLGGGAEYRQTIESFVSARDEFARNYAKVLLE